MFCYQCEQAAKGEGCTVLGVCGKNAEVAALQDLLIYSLQGLSQVAVEGRKVGVSDPRVNAFTCEAAFSTLTNVDFDPQRFVKLINRSVLLRDSLKAKVKAKGGKADFAAGPATFKPEASVDEPGPAGRSGGPQILSRRRCRYPVPEAYPALRHQRGLRPMPTTPGSWGRRTTRSTPSSTRVWPPPPTRRPRPERPPGPGA